MKQKKLGKGMISAQRRKGIQYLLMSIPFVVFVFMFSYVPLFGWILAFREYKLGYGIFGAEFVGWKYFIKLFSDREMIRVLRNTLVFSFMGLITSPLPAVFAILINGMRGNKSKRIVQTLTTLPHFISWVVVYGIVHPFFNNSGVVNQILEMLNMEPVKFGLVGSIDYVWPFQLCIGIWKGIGWSAIIYLAAITGIDQELYDAAKVDGANKLQTEWHITVPGLLPTYFVLLLLDISNLLNSGFEKYYVFWNSMVSDKIEVLDYYVYKLGFGSRQFSYGVAVGMTKSLVSILLLFVANYVSKKVRGNSLI